MHGRSESLASIALRLRASAHPVRSVGWPDSGARRTSSLFVLLLSAHASWRAQPRIDASIGYHTRSQRAPALLSISYVQYG